MSARVGARPSEPHSSVVETSPDGLGRLARAAASAVPEDARRRVAAQVEEMFSGVDLEAEGLRVLDAAAQELANRVRLASPAPLHDVALDAQDVRLLVNGRHRREHRPSCSRSRGSRRVTSRSRGNPHLGSDDDPPDQPEAHGYVVVRPRGGYS
jgi:hypothetical protein